MLGDHNDHFTLVAIRRVLLDVMWARELDTVTGNWARAKRDYITAVNHLSLRTELLLPVLGNQGGDGSSNPYWGHLVAGRNQFS